MFDWMKKNWSTVLIVIIIVIIIVPFLINIAFKVNAINNLFKAEWNAGDVLSYYGDILSFIGTVSLGLLSLWQNKKIEEKSNEHTRYLENIEKIKNLPELKIAHELSNGQLQNLKIRISNISNNIAKNITVSPLKIFDNQDLIQYSSPDPDVNQDYIQPMQSITVSFNNEPINRLSSKKISFLITYFDKFGEDHTIEVVSLLKDNYDFNIKDFINNMKIVEL